MARIRTIKPEILEDEKTAGLSHEAWRLFVSMIALADDHGGLRGDPSWLDGQVFWSSPINGGVQGLDEALEELAAVSLVSLYEVRGQRYAQITNWNKHQKVDHPSKPRVPRFDDPQAISVPIKPDRLYFIQGETSREIKIGVSRNPSRTLARVSEGSREAFRVLLDVPGSLDMCRDIHRTFAAVRCRGDWFRETSEIIDKISELNGQLRFLGDPRESLAKSSRGHSTTLATHTSDHRPPTSDPDPDRERDHARAHAIPPTVVPTPVPTVVPSPTAPIDRLRRLNHEAWRLGYEAAERLRKSGTDPESLPWPPLPSGASTDDLRERTREALEHAGDDYAGALAIITRRVHNAEMIATAEGSQKWMTPSRMWAKEAFWRDAEQTEAQALARYQSARPRAASASRGMHAQSVFDIVDDVLAPAITASGSAK